MKAEPMILSVFCSLIVAYFLIALYGLFRGEKKQESIKQSMLQCPSCNSHMCAQQYDIEYFQMTDNVRVRFYCEVCDFEWDRIHKFYKQFKAV